MVFTKKQVNCGDGGGVNILFTGMSFSHYSGSQMYVEEMAEYLMKQGHDITIVSPNISDAMVDSLSDKNIKLIHLDNIDLDVCYDVIFALHYPIIEDLLTKGIKYEKIVNICLSPYEKVENPVWFHDELGLILANSWETKQKLMQKDGIKDSKIIVLPNFLPVEFIDYKIALSGRLKRVAVVSNHVPEELKACQSMEKTFDIDYFGEEYEQVKVTPEFLAKYDAVISIGKTVQYALGMGVPVFEYDRFGGCGYITVENYQKEQQINFSGRATNRKLSSQEIIDELEANYQQALDEVNALKDLAVRDFSCRNIDDVMAKVAELQPTPFIDMKKKEPFKLFRKEKKLNGTRCFYFMGIRIFSYKKKSKKNR